MNSFDRIFAAVKGESVDKTPIAAVLCMYGARLTNCDLKEYYTNSDKYLIGQLAVAEKFKPDIILSPLCVANEAKAFGCDIKYFEKNPPNITKRAISSIDEINSLKFPDINNNQYIIYIRESVRKLSNQFRGQIPIGAVWMDPIDMLANAIGIEAIMELMIFKKDIFDNIIIKMSEFCVNFGNSLLEDGATILINFCSLGNTRMITRSMAETIAMPVLQNSYSKINGGILLHHGGYKIAPFIDLYKKLPNILGFIIDSKDNLTDARACAGKDLVIAGNIEGPTINKKAPEYISTSCLRMLTEMADDKHYILSTSSADIPYDTEESQINAFIKSSEIYGSK